jgi:uncharacterized protein YbbC (DUF1343 family)
VISVSGTSPAVCGTLIVPESPTDGKYPGIAVPAVRVHVLDRHRYDPVAAAVWLMAAVRAEHADSLRLTARKMDELAGTDRLRHVIVEGADPASLLAEWRAESARFLEARAPFLLYPPELP